LATPDARLAEALRGSLADIKSVTRARQIEISARLDAGPEAGLETIQTEGDIAVALALG